MVRVALMAGLLCGAVLPISAQDPTKTLPDSYTIQFDNHYVRVVRVHLAAGAKLPDHTHPAGTTVYVYLNGSDGVTFSHSGNSNRTVTRPPVKTGAVRVASGPEEHHTAENPASTPSDFLRIWFKTENGGERSRLAPTDQAFANTQMRLTRLTVAAGAPALIETPAQQPALLVSWPSGDTRWIDGGVKETLATAGEFLRVDFLTAPK